MIRSEIRSGGIVYRLEQCMERSSQGKDWINEGIGITHRLVITK